MDHHSEVEAKFNAGDVELKDLFKLLGGDWLLRYKTVAGWDHYYRQGESLMRHRCDGTRKTSEFTVKSRKSANSITDRHEVDLPIREDISADRATAFIRATGWTLDTPLDKVSYIFHVDGLNSTHIACIALYSAEIQCHPETRRWFLEVEIDKDSACSHAEAQKYLAEWVGTLQAALKLGEPLNESLYEIYSKVYAEILTKQNATTICSAFGLPPC